MDSLFFQSYHFGDAARIHRIRIRARCASGFVAWRRSAEASDRRGCAGSAGASCQAIWRTALLVAADFGRGCFAGGCGGSVAAVVAMAGLNRLRKKEQKQFL